MGAPDGARLPRMGPRLARMGCRFAVDIRHLSTKFIEAEMFDPTKLYRPGDPALDPLGSRQTLAHWRSQGRGPCYVKIGGRIAYKGGDLNAWINSHTVNPKPTG